MTILNIPEKKNETLGVRISTHNKEAIKKIAEELGESVSDLILKAVNEYYSVVAEGEELDKKEAQYEIKGQETESGAIIL